MVNWSALKVAGLVVAGLLAFLLVGAAMRFAARILSFALLAMLVVAAGYAVYELYDGWTATESEPAVADHDAGTDAVEDLRERYLHGELSEAEFERELDDALEVEDGARAKEAETE